MTQSVRQISLTPAAGKRLIGQAVAALPEVTRALAAHTVVVLGGTTNFYVARAILKSRGQGEEIDPRQFFRGVVLPPRQKPEPEGRNRFAGDLIFEHGRLIRGKQIFDVAESLRPGDIVVKGANAVNLRAHEAGVLIGSPVCGTMGAILPAVIGRRVTLIVPVGLEKRVDEDIADLAALLAGKNADGPRLLPAAGGRVVTELDAVRILTGATARLAAAGGIAGAEGSCQLAVAGTDDQLELAGRILRECAAEPPFSL